MRNPGAPPALLPWVQSMDDEELIKRCVEDGLTIRRVHAKIEALRNIKRIRPEGLTSDEVLALEALEAEFEQLSLTYLILQQQLASASPASFSQRIAEIKLAIEKRHQEETAGDNVVRFDPRPD